MGRYARYGAALLLLHLAACRQADAPAAGNAAGNAAATTADAAAPAATPAPTADARLVVAFGDSLYAGYRLAPGEGFAPQLERALRAGGTAARVVNAGVSGETSGAGRDRLAFTLDGLPRRPDLVIVGLGANDMLRGLSPAATRANLDAICAELKRRGIPIMLTGMLAAPNLGAGYARDFDAIYPALAAKYDAPLDPFFLAGVITDRRRLLDDGLHPNPAGVAAIVRRVAPQVSAALAK